MITANYKVTTPFGTREEGEILECQIIFATKFNKSILALVYYPKSKHECTSVELCKYDRKGRYWISVNDETYINIEMSTPKFNEFLKSIESGMWDVNFNKKEIKEIFNKFDL